MKVAIVTGGTSGLGFAVAATLARDGFEVHAISRRTGVDVSRAEECVRYVRGLNVDVLVNCAGTLGVRSAWRRAFDVNLIGTINMVRAVVPRMPNGKIVNIAGGGVGGGEQMRGHVEYVTSKAAVVAYTEAMNHELPGIEINCISPGPIQSEMNPKGGSPDRALELISWLCSDECKVSGRLFGAKHWSPGNHGGVLRWTPCA